ncbi:type 1 glutamine amidotransferase [Lentilactobacillus hilgardii]|uniref:Lipid II isoglutaminyl synthase (glutamine-hydrolyzing) subunit GatD n=1 Tax=Lentilactobacillus hilgardii (strain ATCC 8290 / DSM 20176 / CCUG 30140 / JCM 1155 / KCTC 3500 / NBRC 15886 / NCIMB 8040 / NRRL B-1843 / 9) TaxID=1423757 RepID=C0XL65_LENH9|nr:glutamine amidotransferase [Lentilactobacillus hilgardii]EEI18939.1 CobB/CobQ-like protein [Lentilactobacillus buchneri ATCC 11577]EEI23810.1 CobB/CobQ-like protein [Lentilactobacillus hilgardii DSM 20176 = ATCC 8290]KRK59179.1 cobyric acid synthase [Lentilactobacillus hilgardii DSM 20176 = ATCC 8290]MCP9333586.1 glutamine amidotransferase [Lentilactobacillus hilgardii]MCP9350163.1 glutamine amidotransferase [Lentilactobacillus hilgardii]
MAYSLNVCHLYGDLMNTYGDLGNILVLKYLANKMGVQLTSEVISLDQKFDADKFDIVVFGGGQDFEQSIISKDIQSKKKDLTDFIEDGGSVVAICGGYQLLGHYYIGANGEKLMGIGALDHYTDKQKDHRFIGNVVIENEETGEKYHGFENHQGITFLGKGERPLGKVLEGHGNNGQDKTEGAIYKNVYCTYFHGPILARNNDIAKHVLINALKRKYPDADLGQAEQVRVGSTF